MGIGHRERERGMVRPFSTRGFANDKACRTITFSPASPALISPLPSGFVASSRLIGTVIPTGSLEDNLSELKITGGSRYEIFNSISLYLVS